MIPGPEEQYMNPAGLGLFGPMIAALIAARVEAGRGGVGAFWRSIWKWRVSPIWYVVALGLPAAGYVVVRGVYGLFVPDAGPWLFPPADAQHVAAMIIAPIGEEIGWRGFAIPRLQQRYSRLTAAVILGALWGVWHLMMYLMIGTPTPILVASILFLIPGSVMFSWIYNRSGGSAFMAILAHMGVHLSNPNQALPGNTTPFWISVVAYSLLGIVVLADRDAWKQSVGAMDESPRPA
jgi:membrane protease YdiL (CAAX protease family)